MAENFEQKSGLWVPESHRTISPDRKREIIKEVEESVTKRKQQEAEEKRKQEEIEERKRKHETWINDPMRGEGVREKIRKIEEEMAEEKAKSAASAEKSVSAEPEVKTSAEADEESKRAQWRTAAAEAEMKTAGIAEQGREATREEIARHLVERPGEALNIFKKGVGLKLEKAIIGFTSFWKKAGAEVLKGASLPTEKVVGHSLGKVSETVWAAQEYLLTRPGAKRLEKVLAIQANIENLKKAGAITEDQANYLLKDIMKQYHGASGDIFTEDEAHRQWEDRKKNTLSAMKTFGHLAEKLGRWAKERQAGAAGRKEGAKQKRAAEIAKKF